MVRGVRKVRAKLQVETSEQVARRVEAEREIERQAQRQAQKAKSEKERELAKAAKAKVLQRDLRRDATLCLHEARWRVVCRERLGRRGALHRIDALGRKRRQSRRGRTATQDCTKGH